MSGVPSALEALAALATEAGAARLADEARALARRSAEGLFYVACVGQFKRGKSTLIDALIDDPVLPTGVVPVTALPTVVRYGAVRAARVRLREGSWRDVRLEDLAEYVSDQHNPENKKGILGVEVIVPNALLEGGMCLVDTPGLSSTSELNTLATLAFIPQIDAAIVLIGTDPPLTKDELDVVETLARSIPDLLFVLNKADRASDSERAEAAAFAQRLLELRLHRTVRIYHVSAKERLDGVGPRRDWDALADALTTLRRSSARALASRAAQRGLSRVGARLLAELARERVALSRPIEETARLRDSLTQVVADAERSLADLGHLFAAEQARLSRSFGDRRTQWLSVVRPVAAAELAGELRATTGGRWGVALRRNAMRAATRVAARHVVPWLATEEREAAVAFERVMSRFVAMAGEFLDRSAVSAVPDVGRLSHELDADRAFGARSGFHFHELLHLAEAVSPFRFVADVLLVVVGARRAILRDAERFLERLLETNSTRVESELMRRVLEGGRQLEFDVRDVLQQVLRSADRGLDRARLAHASGLAAVEGELEKLARLERRTRALIHTACRDPVMSSDQSSGPSSSG